MRLVVDTAHEESLIQLESLKGGGNMEKREHLRKNVLKNVELFRIKQRQPPALGEEQRDKHQYRELQDILSPFWAWRALNR